MTSSANLHQISKATLKVNDLTARGRKNKGIIGKCKGMGWHLLRKTDFSDCPAGIFQPSGVGEEEELVLSAQPGAGQGTGIELSAERRCTRN